MDSLSLSQITNQIRATRDGWGDGLVEAGKRDERVVVLTADLKDSTRTERFAQVFPDRFIECGVAEQNMMGIAAGLAAAGKIPFVSSYAVFSPGRNWEQLRLACYSGLPIKIGGGHTGLTTGADGATHQALEDIAITRVLPKMTVLVPANYEQAKAITEESAGINGPVYIRLTKTGSDSEKGAEQVNQQFKPGKVEVWADWGRQAAIIGCGPIMYECLKAAEELKKQGIGVVVVNNHTVKPIDRAGITELASECGAVVTVEDHQIAGGMGSAVAEVLGQNRPVPMEFVGVNDSFGESGKPAELWKKYGLTAEGIAEAVKKVLKRK